MEPKEETCTRPVLQFVSHSSDCAFGMMFGYEQGDLAGCAPRGAVRGLWALYILL